MRWMFLLALPLLVRAENEEEALFLRRIADFWQEGEYQIAKTQIESFIDEYPESLFSDPLCAALGDLFLREKNFSNALNYYSQVQSPEFIQKVFLNRMQCLYEMQWYATLADECEAHLALTSDLQVSYFLAIALYQQCLNASQETEQLHKLALRARPYFESLYSSEFSKDIAAGYAHLCCILKDYSTAISIYRDLAQNNVAQEEEMLFQIALIQAEFDKTLALETFDQIAQLKLTLHGEALYNWMVVAFELEQFEAIVSRDLLGAMPQDRVGTARLFKGRSLLHLERYQEAAHELVAFIREAPSSETLFAALLSLLDAAYKCGDLETLDEAINKLAHCYPQNPELPKAYFSRAQLLKREDRLPEARSVLEHLMVEYPSFGQKVQVAFELIHLDYKAQDWISCYQKGQKFLQEFPDHELTPFAFRYYISSSAEIAHQNPEHKEQLVTDLTLFLHYPLSDVEKEQWQLLLAKTHFELQQYDLAIGALNNQTGANSKILLALCYQQGRKDVLQFCSLAEEALKEGANLVDPAGIHASLYNAYLSLSDLERAATHLYEAFTAKAEIKIDNLLWLADYYYDLLEEETNLLIAARAAALLNKCKNDAFSGAPVGECKAAIHNPKNDAFSGAPVGECKAALHLDSVVCKLAKVYSLLGRIDDAILLLEPMEAMEAKLILAENYAKKGMVDEAIQLFDLCATGRSPIAASATIQGVKLKLSQASPDYLDMATKLKNVVLQKQLGAEPLYLEAALDYVEIASQNDPVKKKALLLKTKNDFEQQDDILSKDYHTSRLKLPKKNLIYEGYMQLIDAEILLTEAKFDTEQQKDLQAKAKTILLQIMEQSTVLSLKERAQKLFANET